MYCKSCLQFKYAFFQVLTLLTLFTSCNQSVIYKNEIQIDSMKWDSAQVVTFNWQVQDTASWYQLNLTLNHSLEMEYQNLYVKSTTGFPDQSQKEQILSFELFDNSGKPTGQCSGSQCNTEINLLPKFKFPFVGNYQISLKQHGRDQSVKGISSFKLEVSKIN